LLVASSAYRFCVGEELMNPKFMRTGTVQRLNRPDGSVIQVEFYGPANGQPIILTHGWGPNSIVWYYVKRQLSDRFRIIVWDLPGLENLVNRKTTTTQLKNMPVI
jgi:hypothetical protein